MFAPYTANDLVRVMETELHERHEAAELRRRRLVPSTNAGTPVAATALARFAAMLTRLTATATR